MWDASWYTREMWSKCGPDRRREMARTYDHTLALMTSTIAAGLASRIERSLPYSKEARTRIIDEAYEMAHEIRELCIDWEGHENGE